MASESTKLTLGVAEKSVEIVMIGLPVPAANAIPANLDDRAEEGDEADNTLYSPAYTFTQTLNTSPGIEGVKAIVNVVFNAGTIQAHQNGAGTVGYHMGIGVPIANEGITTKFAAAWGTATTAPECSLESLDDRQERDGVIYATVYFPLSEARLASTGEKGVSGKGYVAVQYTIGEGQNAPTEIIVYQIDFSNVTLGPAPIEP